MRLLTLSAADIERALPMRACVEAMKEAYRAVSAGEAVQPQRVALQLPDDGGLSLSMPAFVPGAGMGTKLVSVFEENRLHGKPPISGLVVVFDQETGEPAALCDGTFLTAWRTGAASGASTDLLARPDVRQAALFGCGAQARTQAIAIDTVRDLERIVVWAPEPEALAAFVEEMAPRLRAELGIASSPEQAIDGAELVCTATNAREPVFPGERLAPGAHVSAVGAFTPEMTELDVDLLARASVFVDSKPAALEESGELLDALAAGATRAEDWTEIGAVVSGAHPGRRSAEEVTVFKSVGLAAQDVVAAARAVAAARELGIGRKVQMGS